AVVGRGGLRARHGRAGGGGGDGETGVARPRVRAPAAPGAGVEEEAPRPTAGAGVRLVPHAVRAVARRHGVRGRTGSTAGLQLRVPRRAPDRRVAPTDAGARPRP